MGKIIDRARERKQMAEYRRGQRERYEHLQDCFNRHILYEPPVLSLMKSEKDLQAVYLLYGCLVGFVMLVAFFVYLIFFR